MTDYPFIRAAGRLYGVAQSYVDDVLKLAREDNAPADAWAYEVGTSTDPRSRYWQTVSGLESRDDADAVTAHETAAKLRREAERV